MSIPGVISDDGESLMHPVDDRERDTRARARRQRAAQVQRRRLVLLSAVVLVIVVIVALAARSCGSGGGAGSTTTQPTGTGATSTRFTAELTGALSVPAVDTQATAVLTLDYDSTAQTMAFTLEVTHQISSPQLATIYVGLPGEHSNDAVCTLFGGPAKEGNFTGVLNEGTIVKKDLNGSLQGGGTVADLVALIREGKAYATISNPSHPLDAIRGPIK
jgi:hypothetical protein